LVPTAVGNHSAGFAFGTGAATARAGTSRATRTGGT
jgi:hypothetical protein